MTDATRRALRELLAKAAARPWHHAEDGADFFALFTEDYEYALGIRDDGDEEANAELAAAAVNAVESLLDALDAAEAERERLREALGEIAQLMIERYRDDDTPGLSRAHHIARTAGRAVDARRLRHEDSIIARRAADALTKMQADPKWEGRRSKDHCGCKDCKACDAIERALDAARTAGHDAGYREGVEAAAKFLKRTPFGPGSGVVDIAAEMMRETLLSPAPVADAVCTCESGMWADIATCVACNK